MFPGGRQEAHGGVWSMCREGALLSSTRVLGQLRKESRARTAMKVILRLWGRGSRAPKWLSSEEGPGI